MCPSLPNNMSEEETRSARFITVDLGQHTAEYDSADRTLRLSWSGDQTFLSEDEVHQLYQMLCLLFANRDEDQGSSRLSYQLRYGNEYKVNAHTLENVATAILAHVAISEEFAIIFLDGENGVGTGRYIRGEHECIVIEEKGAARGLMSALNKLGAKL